MQNPRSRQIYHKKAPGTCDTLEVFCLLRVLFLILFYFLLQHIHFAVYMLGIQAFAVGLYGDSFKSRVEHRRLRRGNVCGISLTARLGEEADRRILKTPYAYIAAKSRASGCRLAAGNDTVSLTHEDSHLSVLGAREAVACRTVPYLALTAYHYRCTERHRYLGLGGRVGVVYGEEVRALAP